MESTYSQKNSHGRCIDHILDEIINNRDGFFIELGANDGLEQSNTAFFEFHRGWTGLLIEPSLDKYTQCVTNRKSSLVVHGACVSDTYEGSTVLGDFDGSLMSSISGKRLGRSSSVSVPAFTLSKLLERFNGCEIDLLSLDTEGYEMEVLKGLDIQRNSPKYMIIEIYWKDFDDISEFLSSNGYRLYSSITNYNPRDNPQWDGTHNDYLFEKV